MTNVKKTRGSFSGMMEKTVVHLNVPRLIALTVMNCFLLSFVFSEAIAGVVAGVREGTNLRKAYEELMVPSSMGRVTEARYCGSKETVIAIQDLHCHSEVQRNIGKMLKALDEKYGVRQVYIEGAWGAVDTSWLNTVEDSKFRGEIVEALVDGGKLTGAEYYSMTSGRTDLLRGLEDKELYLSNLKRLNLILEDQKTIGGILAGLNADLEGMKAAYCNPKQKKFERTVAAYKAGKLDTRKYYSLLKRYAGKLDIDFSRYRNLAGYLGMIEKEKALNYKRVTGELQAFVGTLKQRLPYAAYQDLARRTGNFAQIDTAYVELARLNEELGPDGRRFPHLERFFACLRENSHLNPIDLVNEEHLLTQEIGSRLAKNRNEREVAFLSGCLRLLEDYTANRISATDYEYFSANLEEFQVLWKVYAGNDKLEPLQDYFDLLGGYYRVNEQRNACFMRNMFGATATAQPRNAAPVSDDLSAVLASLDGTVGVRVIVTGGFHTQGIGKLLEEAGISYLVLTPNVTADTKTSDAIYCRLAQEQERFNTQAYALLALSRAPSAEQALEAARAVMKVVLMPSAEKSVQDNVADIRAKFNEIKGIAKDVKLEVEEHDGGYAVTLQYYDDPKADGMVKKTFLFDRNGREQGENDGEKRDLLKSAQETLKTAFRKKPANFEAMPLKKGPWYAEGSIKDGKRVHISSVKETRRYAKALLENGQARKVQLTVQGKTIDMVVENGIDLTEDDLNALLEEVVDRNGGDPSRLPDTLVIALLERSTHLFEDHQANGFIGVNRAVLETDYAAELLRIGLFHELSHEVTGKSGDTFEQEQLARDIEFAIEVIGKNENAVSLTEFEDDFAQYANTQYFFQQIRDRLNSIAAELPFLRHDFSSHILNQFTNITSKVIIQNALKKGIEFEEVPQYLGSKYQPVFAMHNLLLEIKKSLDAAMDKEKDDYIKSAKLVAYLRGTIKEMGVIVDENDLESLIKELTKDMKQSSIINNENIETAARNVVYGRKMLADYYPDLQQPPVRIDLNDILRFVPNLNETIREAFVKESVGSEPVMVTTDEVALLRVLTNIVINAGEAMQRYEKGENYDGRKFMFAVSVEDKGETVSIRLMDNAGGIPAKSLGNIFEKGWSTNPNPSQTRGFGLAITKKFVEERLKGKISVTSTEGEGTTFTIELPKRLPSTGRKGTNDAGISGSVLRNLARIPEKLVATISASLLPSGNERKTDNSIKETYRMFDREGILAMTTAA